MVEITNVKERCFAEIQGGCSVLQGEIKCGVQCKFYKPKGCEDWVRREKDDEIWLIPPEEYERSNNGQNIQNKKRLHWVIKNV